MLLSGVLFVLVLAGVWVYCLIDAALTPPAVFRGLPKAAWIGIIAVTFTVGGIAWLAYRAAVLARPREKPWLVTRPGARPAHTYLYLDPDRAAARAAVDRHPSGLYRKTPAEGWVGPKGPDDDPDFLRELDRRIKGTSGDESE